MTHALDEAIVGAGCDGAPERARVRSYVRVSVGERTVLTEKGALCPFVRSCVGGRCCADGEAARSCRFIRSCVGRRARLACRRVAGRGAGPERVVSAPRARFDGCRPRAHRVRDARGGPHTGSLSQRDRLPPDRRRGQAPASRRRGCRRAGSGRCASYDVVHGGVACELVHLGSLYHDDVMDEADTRRGVETVNTKWGICRRSWPATSCSPGRRDRGLARDRGRRAARPHDRVAVRRPDRGTAPHLRHRPGRGELPRLDQRQDGLALRHRSAHRGDRRRPRPVVIDALTEYGNAYGIVFQIVDDMLDITATKDSSASRPGTTWSKACTRCR